MAFGYGIAVAQYNGLFGQPCATRKGVYKLEWDPVENQLNLVWHRDDLKLNGVPRFSPLTGLIYGSGRQADCSYVYYGLDWDTGSTKLRLVLGTDSFSDDPGNANTIAEDRSIIFNSLERLVRLRPSRRTGVAIERRNGTKLRLWGETTPGGNYRWEASADLRSWDVETIIEFTANAELSKLEYALPPSDQPRFFRLVRY